MQTDFPSRSPGSRPRRRAPVAAATPHSTSNPLVESMGWEMQNSSNDPNLKAADEFFALAKTAETPFMRAHYERIALRYLSSEGGLKAPAGQAAPTAG